MTLGRDRGSHPRSDDRRCGPRAPLWWRCTQARHPLR